MSETHWKKLTNPTYLGSWDFQKGEERVLTISHITVEEVFDAISNSKKPCTVAYFIEKCKPMVLNKENCKMIQYLHNTPIIERWTNCRITVYVKKFKAFGKLTEGLRIRDKIPPSPQSKQSLVCSDCGNQIQATEKLSAEKVAAGGIQKFGRPVCAECGSKAKESVSDGSNS